MEEKIKKIFLSKSNYCFRILIFILIVLALILAYVLYVFQIIQVDWENIRKINWDAISATALIVTAIVIGLQAFYTKKQAEFSAKNIAFLAIPGVSIFVRSLKTIYKRKQIIDDWKILSLKEKLKTIFIVENNSKTPILLKVKITFKFKGKKLSQDHYWKNPLSINPGIMSYPDVIHLESIITEERLGVIKENGGTISAEIEYKYTPKFIEAYSESIVEHRNFNLGDFEWEGPDGVKDENIYLPGER